jgi:hypothetical protein
VGATRRRRTVTVEDVQGLSPPKARSNGNGNGNGAPSGAAHAPAAPPPPLPRPAPVPAPVAPRRSRPRHTRAVLAGLTVVLVLVLVATAVAAGTVATRAGSVLEALMPPETVVITPGVAAEVPAPATTTTTVPRPELMALRGRPPSPVELEEDACSGPLRAGRLRPVVLSQWNGESPESTSGGVSDTDARAEIALIMRRRFRREEPERAVREAMQLYDSPRLREVAAEEIPVRAALALLKGTLGEPVLRFALTTDRPVRIKFGMVTNVAAAAEAWSYTREITIMVRDEYRYEDPVILAPVLMHELMHQNGQAQQPEEVINNVIDTRVALEMMRDAPGSYSRRTRAVDGQRGTALLQLNTRVGAVLAVDHADVANVLPDFEGPPVASFGAELRTDANLRDGVKMYSLLADAPTKGHQTLADILHTVAPDVALPDKVFFDQAAVNLLDTHAGIGLCDQLVAAEVLGAVPKGSTAQKAARAYLSSLTR